VEPGNGPVLAAIYQFAINTMTFARSELAALFSVLLLRRKAFSAVEQLVLRSGPLGQRLNGEALVSHEQLNEFLQVIGRQWGMDWQINGAGMHHVMAVAAQGDTFRDFA